MAFKHALEKALNHPLRAQIIAVLQETGTLSTSKFRLRTDATPNTIQYHIRVLVRLGVIEIVERIPRKGRDEYLYGFSDSALAAGILDLSRIAGSSTSLKLDSLGVQEVAKVVEQLESEVKRVAAKAGRRLEAGASRKVNLHLKLAGELQGIK
jgi:DNA-binding transcriptional ArsR family regulator